MPPWSREGGTCPLSREEAGGGVEGGLGRGGGPVWQDLDQGVSAPISSQVLGRVSMWQRRLGVATGSTCPGPGRWAGGSRAGGASVSSPGKWADGPDPGLQMEMI